MKRLAFYAVLLGLLFLSLPMLAADTKLKPADGDKAKKGGPPAAAPASDQADEPEPAADTPDVNAVPKRRKISSRPTSIDIIPESSGLKTLSIHFRWSLYPDSSIEVRLVPDPKAKGMEAVPIYFHEQLKGAVRQQLFDCLDHPENAGKVHSFTKDKIVYKMIGRRNSLGNQGVHVQVYKQDTDPTLAPAAAYLQMDTWAVDKETLSLDLSRDEFPKPGLLFVWFFRGDQSVWEEQIRWPGYK